MIVNFREIKLATLLAASLLISSFASAEDATLTKADALIKAGNYKAAYQLLEPLEDERSGDVDFDYLLGVAGVESGNVTRGVFALERVLATQPNHGNARVEIAKAHYLLGEADTSKAEFRNLLDQKPAKETADAINRYMNAIDKSLGLTTTFAAYLDFGLGYDSNVNSAASTSSGAVPGGFFTLGNQSRERSDNFMNLAGGASFRQPITKEISVFSAVNGTNRMNNDQTTFDYSYLDFNGGLKYKKFADTYTAALQANTFGLDGERFRNSYGGIAQWQRDLDDKNQVNVFGQASRITYKGNSFRDADRYVIGGGWAHVFPGDKSPVIFIGGSTGKEETRDSDADFLSNTIYGVRGGGQLSLNTKLVAYTSASFEYRDYDKEDIFFGKTRRDNQYDVAVGLRYLPGYNWIIRPQISYSNNESNIFINDYDRTVVSVNFRHDFNW